MLTFVVVPCLDEAGFIADAAASLGFALGVEPPRGTELLIVDNGSTDGSVEEIGRLVEGGRGRVRLLREPLRGYVPPRHRGVVGAAAFARERGVAAADVLVLQADADTIYGPGYVTVSKVQRRAPGCHSAKVGTYYAGQPGARSGSP